MEKAIRVTILLAAVAIIGANSSLAEGSVLYATGYYGVNNDEPLFKLDATTGALISQISTPFKQVHDVAFAPDGTLYATGTYGINNDEPLFKLDPNTGALITQISTPFKYVHDIAFAPDGTLYATGYYGVNNDEPLFKLDATTGALISQISTPFKQVHDVAFNSVAEPDAAMLYISGLIFLFAIGRGNVRNSSPDENYGFCGHNTYLPFVRRCIHRLVGYYILGT